MFMIIICYLLSTANVIFALTANKLMLKLKEITDGI